MRGSGVVTFLTFDAFGRGGVARTVTNLANMLGEHRKVRVLSLFRHGTQPGFPLDPTVELEVLLDLPGGLGPVQRRLHRRGTGIAPVPVERQFSKLTDRVLRRRLDSMEPGVLVSTRPSLHLAASLWAAPDVRLVGQEHRHFGVRFTNPRQAAVLDAALPALDAYVVLTDADASDYRRHVRGSATHIEVIRNALAWPVPTVAAPLERPVIVAAGRLTREKGFERMIAAFEPVARAHPDWQLHIYGNGPRRAALETRIRVMGLGSQVLLPGHVEDIRGVLEGASAFALSSLSEGFSMVLIEAMSAGLPLVSFDCPRGPGEIVEDGQNGFLVRDGDIAGFTSALSRLVEDVELRRRLGERAHRNADRYSAQAVVSDWLELFDRVTARAPRRLMHAPPPPRRHAVFIS